MCFGPNRPIKSGTQLPITDPRRNTCRPWPTRWPSRSAAESTRCPLLTLLRLLGQKPSSERHGAHTLRSAFQPIFSLSHRRVVGHEALLRASNAAGLAVSPQTVFAAAKCTAERQALDATCRRLHTLNFAAASPGDQWLFLNVDASVFSDQIAGDPIRRLADIANEANLSPGQVVIELLETALPIGADIEYTLGGLRRQGFLLALDDFGAGHSNFDRVFRLQPHIVKLDRTVIARAAEDTSIRRVTSQMISLLHECGALVLIEGVESALEAAIALDADADFVQGYHFGRPAYSLLGSDQRNTAISDVWEHFDSRSQFELGAYRERIRPYAEALLEARTRLLAGDSMPTACSSFLALAHADICYLIDADGSQIGGNLYGAHDRPLNASLGQFAPLLESSGARWSRRPYFRRAVLSPGQLQVTRPYPTMQSHRMCMTLSICLDLGPKRVVLCGDMFSDSSAPRPGFGITTLDANL